MSKTYFITLAPYDLYFFGGEQEERADYYLKGNPIPQQTALLGMVRYQILAQNGLLENNRIKDDHTAKEWIGTDSFKHDVSDRGFGKIVSISPCHIVEKTGMKKYLPTYPVYMEGWKCVGDNYFLPAYDPKKEYSLRWKNVENAEILGADRRSEDGEEFSYYKEVERVGVDKNYSGTTENDSFFKQVWLKMEKDIAFGFYLTLEEDVILQDADVSLGKENSSFRMTVRTENAPDGFQENQQGKALVLTSDAYVNPDFFMKSKCSFAVCDTIPFRNLANKTSSSHEHYRGEKNGRIQLLKRGSVFIADNIDEVADELKKHKNFYKIGYNTFQIIKIN